MVLDFQFKKRGNEFLLDTGMTLSDLASNYKQEYDSLSSFKTYDNYFIVPRIQLCDVLDNCFDHFTEDSLMNITKLLDKNDEVLRDKITEHSVSKKKKMERDRKKEKELFNVQNQLKESERRVVTPIRHEKKPDLNYDEPIPKTELLKMFYNIKSQMDVMERYLHRLK
jgi:hypothetical protein